MSKKIIDPSGTAVRYLKDRIFQPESRGSGTPVVCSAGASSLDMLPPVACTGNASASVCSRFVYASGGNARSSVNGIVWTPEGRRLLAGNNKGMFTMWSGINFTFEMTQSGHEVAVRALVWNHAGEWMVSADEDGIIKYWSPSLNNVKEIKDAHVGFPARELSFCPTDAKFCSCSDDASVKIWDFERGALDRALVGAGAENGKSHGWDVKSAQWHPEKALIVSGSKDNVIKLWDPRAPSEICALHLHKSTVTSLRWHPEGPQFASGSKDKLVKLFDLRAMREAAAFKGHKREVTALAWHPIQPDLFCSADQDGAILFWSALQSAEPLGESIGRGGRAAHDFAVWTLAWHPLGHLLCSGGQDNLVKFWSRDRPGDARKRQRDEEEDELFEGEEREMRMAQLAREQF